MMSASSGRPAPPKQKKRPPPWRKPEDEELRDEIRDLENDVALHSVAHSGAKDDRTPAHSEQPGAQECSNNKAICLGQDIHDLERDIVPSPNVSTRGARALKCAEVRAARLDAAQANISGKPSPNVSTRGMSALKRAEVRTARLKAAQAVSSGKPSLNIYTSGANASKRAGDAARLFAAQAVTKK